MTKIISECDEHLSDLIVLLWYKTVFFGTILVQTSILLYKTVFYR